ncbi:tRNA dimethylallyltransferase [Pleurostoma richardsiae]|uniref:tRNA dimethylallyltransferase n=1 Tax=Pleurostoma richardsiae TaxID=41990 RepID=A0AA38RGN7_9PEZI|nr:tRNA dimethylallyltransferase [Pleurostoma richardsiae]
MSQLRPRPTEPLVVIMGSTGTGKSELAVELATRFNGEIINADAMQMYRGSPIITNKIPLGEQRSIPHHLLGTVGLEEDPWAVGLFKREASRIIREIRSRGRLPIVVGGTHYYLDGLLFDNHLVDDTDSIDAENGFLPTDERSAVFPILEAPTEVIWKKLKEVDPVMAERWHPNNRRKIQRSLEIFLSTGRRASDIYAEQEKKKASKWSSEDGPQRSASFQSLLFWVYTQREVLNARLDKRVDKMVENGLLEETRELFQYAKARAQAGEPVNLTQGIWQSIGFKQFGPYVKGIDEGADPVFLEQLKQSSIENTKTATRQYAKHQIRWITKKTLPLLRDEHALRHLYLLDSTDVSQWSENVGERAAGLTRQFLDGQELPEPSEVSETAKEVLAATITASSAPKGTPCQKTCDLCKVTAVTEERWALHLSSHRHRKSVRHAKRTALVVLESPSQEPIVGDREQSISSGPSTAPEPS